MSAIADYNNYQESVSRPFSPRPISTASAGESGRWEATQELWQIQIEEIDLLATYAPHYQRRIVYGQAT
jgi:hypothetical protein